MSRTAPDLLSPLFFANGYRVESDLTEGKADTSRLHFPVREQSTTTIQVMYRILQGY